MNAIRSAGMLTRRFWETGVWYLSATLFLSNSAYVHYQEWFTDHPVPEGRALLLFTAGIAAWAYGRTTQMKRRLDDLENQP